MTDEQFRQLKTMILDLGVKVEALALENRALRKAVETTEVVYLEDKKVSTTELEALLRTRSRPAPSNDTE
ncbi:hypothetical protein JET14_13305 [Martelella lutilitoris]|uniref:Uncharacterized protein n=1 Tax=Martelella lutilitoris TaxID=2583532 RepID=A0A7T7HHH9_9HYPH|nr:hypothetical protein [Martelella lutilitoris]QQM29303.1 hypothetical protein JET14_13305 [Martelella lutilitoris]